ncbi:Dabb family protein [Pararhodonellum marinum]|uniref:Dabb family protein n=1 Tax=Pararhodonellum marinum TaxID=2755358 RepID=UPI0018903D95|nr:Dabb family protein [Pararhodonellum marinum]
MSNRRKFIQNLTAISAMAIMPQITKAENQKNTKMIHQVYFWLNEPEKNTAPFLKAVKTLAKIKTIKSSYIGTPAPTERRPVVDHSFQVACTFFFDSLEDQLDYQSDPDHLKFIEENSDKWNKVQVYDFTI